MVYVSTHGFIDSIVVEASVDGITGYYIIRGYLHPENHLVVESYRYPNCRPSPPAPREFNECFGVTTYMIPREKILRIISPERSLRLLPERVQRRITELLDYLGLEWAGITGSYAIGCETPSSDVDIVGLYKRGVKRALMDLAYEGLIKQCKYQDIIKKRTTGPGGIALDTHKISMSLTDTCFRGQPYTLRLVTSLWDKVCDKRFITYGVSEYVGRMIPINDPITVPTRYILETGKTRLIVETWRTRYQEIEEGYYRVRGLLRFDASSNELILWPDKGGLIDRIEPAFLTDRY